MIKQNPVLLLLFLILFTCSGLLYSQSSESARMIAANAGIHDSVSQLLLVYNEFPSSETAVMYILERKAGLNKKATTWKVVGGPVKAGIGRNGFAAPGLKREGDKKSPTGLFELGPLFSTEKKVSTKMPYSLITNEDKWIDDPDSPDYNCHIKGETSAKSFEKLQIPTNDYKYCMVIKYNMNPVVKDMGSAIFLHLPEGADINASAGCIVVKEKDMLKILKWLDPKCNPSVLMGNMLVLRQTKGYR